MERLTWKSHDGSSAYADMDGNMVSDYDGASILTGRVVDKLADYEDLEEQGLLLRLPCKIGDTVWCVFTGCTGKHPIVMSDTFDYKMIPYFDIGCFLTRDKANKALKALKEMEGK